MRTTPSFSMLYRFLFSIVMLAALLGAAPMRPAAAAEAPVPVVDQSFSAPSGASAAINDCCRYVAQTFTAGMTGALTAVSLDVLSTSPFFLKVAIHGVTDGLPDSTVLSDAYIWGAGGAPQPAADLSLRIDVGTVYVQQGHQYAIVVDYEGSGSPGHAEGSWVGAPGDAYAGGAAYASNDETFADWTPLGAPALDLHFKTYVVPGVPVHDLSVTFDGGAKHSKACESFDETLTIHNNGPDPASAVVLSIGLTDQFDVVSIDGQPGPYPMAMPLAPGESRQIKVRIKATAFVPGESRDGRFSGWVTSDVWPAIELDPNETNDYYFGSVRLISKGAQTCPPQP